MPVAKEHGELLHIDRKTARALRSSLPDYEIADQVAGRFRALADPTRLGLALALRDGQELCVCDLSWIAQRSQNLVSHHMRSLRSEGVVRSRREGKMTMYSLTPAGEELVDASLVQLRLAVAASRRSANRRSHSTL
jgi:ArsR family transcriptional regulator, lead/cadmium/zinc/bismuth-responsive transcriptional repressor